MVVILNLHKRKIGRVQRQVNLAKEMKLHLTFYTFFLFVTKRFCSSVDLRIFDEGILVIGK